MITNTEATRATIRGAEMTVETHLPGLLDHHTKALHERGLTDQTIAAAGIRSETNPVAAAVALRWAKPRKGIVPAMVIPFDDGYCRLRPDTPRKVKQKPVKYESPRELPNKIYFPPGTRERIPDAGEVLFTEGEFKALALWQVGFVAVGLVGCLGWKEKRHERLLPELEAIEWTGINVVIVFDSDIDRKSDVLLAETKFAKHLTDRGAIVRCVRMPDGPADPNTDEPVKQGADDFLVRHGLPELRKLIDAAIEPEAPDAGDTKERAERIEPATMGRLFLEGRQSDDLYHIRHWRGTCWNWDGTRYVELEPSELRARLVLEINREGTAN